MSGTSVEFRIVDLYTPRIQVPLARVQLVRYMALMNSLHPPTSTFLSQSILAIRPPPPDIGAPSSLKTPPDPS
jgi:hypothetical protein